jgi:hypothetical protein
VRRGVVDGGAAEHTNARQVEHQVGQALGQPDDGGERNGLVRWSWSPSTATTCRPRTLLSGEVA